MESNLIHPRFLWQKVLLRKRKLYKVLAKDHKHITHRKTGGFTCGILISRQWQQASKQITIK